MKSDKLLTEQSRSDLIDEFIKANIKDAKETDGLETIYYCDLHNGCKGYTHYTDRELLAQAVFYLYGFDIKWRESSMTVQRMGNNGIGY